MPSQRRLSRIAAMQTVFSALYRKDISVLDELNYIVAELPEVLQDIAFAKELVSGVTSEKENIEAFIQKFAADKSLERIDPLTLSILYIATYELAFVKEKQPTAVILNEAIEIAKEFGKDSSPALVNAILSQVSKNLID